MNEIKSSCYYCGKPKTSMEHVPPKVFFPDEKYSFDGQNKRQNLITVPSCDEHNSAKSELDEFLFSVITISATSNEQGQHLASKKAINKVMVRNRYIPHSIFSSSKIGLISRNRGRDFKPTLAWSVDRDKLDNCFEHIAKGIYFHHFKKVYTRSVQIDYEFKRSTSKNSEKINQKSEKHYQLIKERLADIEKHGENPDIFYYQILQDTIEVLFLQLSFYESTKVDIFFNHTRA